MSACLCVCVSRDRRIKWNYQHTFFTYLHIRGWNAGVGTVRDWKVFHVLPYTRDSDFAAVTAVTDTRARLAKQSRVPVFIHFVRRRRWTLWQQPLHQPHRLVIIFHAPVIFWHSEYTQYNTNTTRRYAKSSTPCAGQCNSARITSMEYITCLWQAHICFACFRIRSPMRVESQWVLMCSQRKNKPSNIRRFREFPIDYPLLKHIQKWANKWNRKKCTSTVGAGRFTRESIHTNIDWFTCET